MMFFIYKKYYNFIALMRINQPIGFFLLLWPTLWGLWFANDGMPDIYVFVIFVLGVFCIRSAGCVINDYVDCDIDMQVQRTKYRPLPNKKITKKKALWVFFILVMFALGLVSVFSIITILVAGFGIVWIVVYPYLKRYMCFPQLVLGILFSWSILMAFLVVNHDLDSTFWLLFFANTIWVIVYDTQYAMVDRDDDQYIGVRSSAILFGKMDRLIIGILQLCMVLILSMIGWKEKLSIIFYLFSVLGPTVLFIWQQSLIYKREKLGCFKAFLNNNYVGMFSFIGIMLNFY